MLLFDVVVSGFCALASAGAVLTLGGVLVGVALLHGRESEGAK